ncbi:recombination regulator RecX [uncultured Limosilactobacillus sp.]|uniref:recombination regulator RecX n=1 Tax=uncultured Limosilactobacillus sp. TaxID=2837629 RepID=UPI002601135C|nr:recombination regulator RecX [uncultured Limosilactobacillus sp.]
MQKITKIEAQKRKGRYNVYLDGQYAFPVAESVLIKYRLMKGMELEQSQIAQITTDDEIAKAYGRMLDYLSHQLRTEKEVIQKLREIETPDEYVEPILQKLRGERLVDDHNYAMSYVRTVMRTELKGPNVIRQKLRLKGVGELEIDAALEQFTDEKQLGNAAKLAQKLYKRYRRQPIRRQEEKVRQGLMTNGYRPDFFNQIKEAVEPEADEEQQNELLDRQAQKLIRRYQKYQGYERQMKLKQALYRKGFDLDEIDHWITEHLN